MARPSYRNVPSRRADLVKSGGTELLAPTIDYVLVDSSGSMWDKWKDCIASLDAYIDTMRARNLNSHLLVQVFGGARWDWIQRDHKLSDWVPFSQDPLEQDGGGTPLYQAINAMGLRLRDLMPERCSIVIVTDGDADDSPTGDAARHARAVLDWMRAQGWQVTFIGCDFDNAGQAAALGSEPQNFIGVQKGFMKEAGKLLGDKRLKYEHGGDMEFSDDEKTKFGGFLAGPGSK